MTRDASINWDAPVRTIEIKTGPGGKPLRDPFKSVWTLKGKSPIFAGQPGISWEGENERRTLWFEKFVRRSTQIVSQPEMIRFEIDGYIVAHISDFLAERATGIARIGVKGATAFAYAPWMSAKLRAIARAYAEWDLAFEIVTAMDLRRPPLNQTVDEVCRARRVVVDLDALDRVRRRLVNGPSTLGDVLALLGPGDPRRALSLHAQGILTIDLKSHFYADSAVTGGLVDLGPYGGDLP